MKTQSVNPIVSQEEVVKALRLIVPPGQVTELRVLDAVTSQDRRPHVESGYFDDIDKLAAAAATITKAVAFYITPNPVNPALLSRAANRIRPAWKEPTTADHDIERRCWLLVDCDAKKPAGISSTDDEHTASLELASRIRAELDAEGWSAPIMADSSNGAHLLYRVDLPTDDGGLVKRCLEALAARFNTEKVTVDTAVYNTSRIWKLYGTLACKGDNTPERPHRMSRVLEAPETLSVVVEDKLNALAASAPPPDAPQHKQLGWNVEDWIQKHTPDVEGPRPWGDGGRRWIFPICPWNTDHTNRSAYIVQHRSGAVEAGCHHVGCQGKKWHDLRDAFEPGWRDKRRDNKKPQSKPKPRQPVELPPYRPFPLAALPRTVGEYIQEASTAIGCDPAFVTLPTLACLARAIGNKRSIRLKRSWHEMAIIWGAIVGKSGTHKSPAMQAATGILERKQAEVIAAHKEAMAEYVQDEQRYQRELAQWKRKKTDEPPPWPPEEPVCQRYICSDITIEALAERLAAQFDGVLVVRDELAGWLDGLAEYKGGKGSDTGHWLSCWNSAPMTVDRKTGAKKMLHVPRASVSLVGGIQPAILRRAISREHLHDGLCARLLVAFPAWQPITWTDATVSPATESRMSDVFDSLLSLEPAADPEGKSIPYAMPLTPEAHRAWVSYYNRHRAEMAELDDDLAAAYSKLEAYAARFALIFQLCSWADGQVTADKIDQASIDSGVAVSDWFAGEAQRVYGLFVETDDQRQDRELIELIRRHGGRITARKLAHKSTRYRAPGAAEEALRLLSSAGVGHWETDHTTGGRPASVFVLTLTSGNGNATPSNHEENGQSVTLRPGDTLRSGTYGTAVGDANARFQEAANEDDEGETEWVG